ncbi:MAG: hypothetical protein Q8877_02635 [Sweet potato little leaf phytoplasma]|nr:hypothetical protein [Sweet potato little leaf phytoplasma]
MDELARIRAHSERKNPDVQSFLSPLLTPARPPVYASPTIQESSGFFPQMPSIFSPTPMIKLTASPVQRTSRPKKQKTPKLASSSSSEDDATTSQPTTKPHGKDAIMQAEALIPIVEEEVSNLSSISSTPPESSVEWTDKENSEKGFADISQILMAENEESAPYYESPPESIEGEPSSAPSKKQDNGGPLFTFDDIPPEKWRKRLLDFKAWLDTKFLSPSADSYKVIEEFCSRMTGILKEWYETLGAINQDAFLRSRSVAEVIGHLHVEFIGNVAIYNQILKQEFFDMKCCSLKIKDLNRHYKRMSQPKTAFRTRYGHYE